LCFQLANAGSQSRVLGAEIVILLLQDDDASFQPSQPFLERDHTWSRSLLDLDVDPRITDGTTVNAYKSTRCGT